MSFDDYKLVVYRNQPDGWVAEIPSIPGCYALMPTAEEAVSELAGVFRLIEEEYRESGRDLPLDTTATFAWPTPVSSEPCGNAASNAGNTRMAVR